MSPARIRTRTTSTGDRRHIVLYRLGGRGFPDMAAGTFGTLREAKLRRDLVAGEIAAGRDPRLVLAQMAAPKAPKRKFKHVGEAMIASRHDWSENTIRRNKATLEILCKTFGDLAPEDITVPMIQEWIGAQIADGARASTLLINRRQTLRHVIDHAGIDPNPARSKLLRWPKNDSEETQPPSADHVTAMIRVIAAKHVEMFALLERCGCEISAALNLTWADIDFTTGKIRLRRRKTGRVLWAQVPDFILDRWRDVPADDRHGRVYKDVTDDGFRKAMEKACEEAGIPRYSPHSLRHRRGTIWHHDGVVARELAERMGHSSTKESLDTYSHVVHPGEIDELLLADLVRTRCGQIGA